MSLSQLHYTSAPPGPEGSGFRFTAVSPDIPHSVLREAETVIGYEPPRSAPPRPTDVELRSFPRAFTFTILSDGSRLLSRTVYTGADYSGRWGNFHAHGIHLPAGRSLPGGALPITAWDSAGWAGSTPSNGAPAAMDALPPAGGLDRTGLIEFAVSRGPWLPGVLADLRRQAEDTAAPQIVIVERDSADVARWVALASAALPRECAHQLTFITYTRRPQLARQQLIGVLPDDSDSLRGHEGRYRIHDCTGSPPVPGVTDAWANSAAQTWLAGEPELFARSAGLPGAAFSPGPTAVVALLAGLRLTTDGRTAAAEWALLQAASLDDASLQRLISMLSAPAPDRTAAESSVLARLFERLEGTVAAEVTAPLAALVLIEAVRADISPLALPRRSSLTDGLRQSLATELLQEIRSGLTSTGSGPGHVDAQPHSRPLQLLRIAGLLGVDCTDLLPGVSYRLARTLMADPRAYTGAVGEAVDELDGLRTALLDKLDNLAMGDPVAAAGLLTLTALSTGTGALPHLRMCAWAAGTAPRTGDRVAALHRVLKASGSSPIAEPPVLRTAFRLVWPDAAPSAGDARLVLDEIGAEAHRAAGTWSVLVDAALSSSADDLDAPDLAHELLRCFPDDLETTVRAALLLLEFARDLRDGCAGSGWAERVLALRAAAGPIQPAVLEQAFSALSHALLAESCPDPEWNALVRSGDAELCDAYGRAAREERVRNRLRDKPTYAADCFTKWNSHPQAGRAWSDTRVALLDQVLRPVVRAMPAEDLSAVERALEAVGGHWLEDFRNWNRPGALGRLGLRFTGRGRRESGGSSRRGDAGQPRKGGGR